jgi:hypothetical protein
MSYTTRLMPRTSLMMRFVGFAMALLVWVFMVLRLVCPSSVQGA